ncbi:hypothetical protein [Scytonema sp. NUACC21]
MATVLAIETSCDETAVAIVNNDLAAAEAAPVAISAPAING